jgi:hypothetical protein
MVETRNPPAAGPVGQAAEGLDYRFLQSQPRVIGPWITPQGATLAKRIQP